MRELVPAWPPGACRSSSSVRRPFGGTVDRRRETGRPGAHDHQVVQVAGGGHRAAEPLRHLPRVRAGAVPTRPRRTAPAAPPRRPPPASSSARASGSRVISIQRYGIRLLARKSLIACERGDHWCPTSRRPASSGGRSACHASSSSSTTGKSRSSGGSHGFDEVVVEVCLVDRLDGRLDVRVGGEQHAPGQRIDRRGSAPAPRCRACRACAGRSARARAPRRGS